MIKFSTGEKVEDIARKVELSRSHLTVLFNDEKKPPVYDKLYSIYHQKIVKKINESIHIYIPAAAELSSAREPQDPYGVSIRAQLSPEVLKAAVDQLEAALALLKNQGSDINRAAAKADRVSRKSNKSVGGR
jgi:hypothetical protein